jgi:copper chaperone CopZ
MKSAFSLVGLAAALAIALPSFAGEVSIEGVHICCGSCVRGVNTALKDVKGVSAVAASQDGTIKFTAADDAAVKAGIEALAKGGFHGTAKHGGAPVAFPEVKTSSEKVKSLSIAGVHLCCGACYTEATAALKGVKGVSVVESDKKTKTLKITGENISAAEAIQALFDVGFHGTIAQ